LFRRPKLTLSYSAEGKVGRKEGRKEGLINVMEKESFISGYYIMWEYKGQSFTKEEKSLTT
jgi:hypothetical protein